MGQYTQYSSFGEENKLISDLNREAKQLMPSFIHLSDNFFFKIIRDCSNILYFRNIHGSSYYDKLIISQNGGEFINFIFKSLKNLATSRERKDTFLTMIKILELIVKVVRKYAMKYAFNYKMRMKLRMILQNISKLSDNGEFESEKTMVKLMNQWIDKLDDKFSPSGGKLLIRCRDEGQETFCIKVRDLKYETLMETLQRYYISKGLIDVMSHVNIAYGGVVLQEGDKIMKQSIWANKPLIISKVYGLRGGNSFLYHVKKFFESLISPFVKFDGVVRIKIDNEHVGNYHFSKFDFKDFMDFCRAHYGVGDCDMKYYDGQMDFEINYKPAKTNRESINVIKKKKKFVSCDKKKSVKKEKKK